MNITGQRMVMARQELFLLCDSLCGLKTYKDIIVIAPASSILDHTHVCHVHMTIYIYVLFFDFRVIS